MLNTPKLLNISRITKRIGNFFKLPIQLYWGISYPELAFLVEADAGDVGFFDDGRVVRLVFGEGESEVLDGSPQS